MVSTSRLVKRLPTLNPVHKGLRWCSGVTRCRIMWKARSRVMREGQEEDVWAYDELPSSAPSARKGPRSAGTTQAPTKAGRPGKAQGSVPSGVGCGTPKSVVLGSVVLMGRLRELPLNPFFPKHHLPCESVNQEVFIELEETPQSLRS